MLSENIKTIRENKGFTQETLASKLNVTRQTVSKWEKGYSVPDADLLERMANVLEVNVSDLLGDVIPAKKETYNQNVADQLAQMNEQLAIKNARSKKIWKVIAGIAIALLAAVLLLVVLNVIPSA